MSLINTFNMKIMYNDQTLGRVTSFDFDELNATEDGLFKYSLKMIATDDNFQVKTVDKDGEIHLVEEVYEGYVRDIEPIKVGESRSIKVILHNMEKKSENEILAAKTEN